MLNETTPKDIMPLFLHLSLVLNSSHGLRTWLARNYLDDRYFKIVNQYFSLILRSKGVKVMSDLALMMSTSRKKINLTVQTTMIGVKRLRLCKGPFLWWRPTICLNMRLEFFVKECCIEFKKGCVELTYLPPLNTDVEVQQPQQEKGCIQLFDWASACIWNLLKPKTIFLFFILLRCFFFLLQEDSF